VFSIQPPLVEKKIKQDISQTPSSTNKKEIQFFQNESENDDYLSSTSNNFHEERSEDLTQIKTFHQGESIFVPITIEKNNTLMEHANSNFETFTQSKLGEDSPQYDNISFEHRANFITLNSSESEEKEKELNQVKVNEELDDVKNFILLYDFYKCF